MPLRNGVLDCLACLTAHYGKPRSVDALRAGMAETAGAMSAASFVEAARAAGFAARAVNYTLDDLHALLLPAVLVLNDGQACLLMSRPQDGICRILLPEIGGTQDLPREELRSRYAGHALLVRPLPSHDQPVEDFQTPHFRGILDASFTVNWSLYGQAAVATVLINLFLLASPFYTQIVFDRIMPNSAVETLTALSIGILMVILFDFVIRSLRAHFIGLASQRAQALLSARVFERVADVRMEARPPSAGALTNIVRDLDTVQDFLTSATLLALIDLPFCVVFLLVIGLIGGPLGIVTLVAALAVFATGLAVQLPLGRLTANGLRQTEARNAVLYETSAGLETVKIRNAGPRMRRLWDLSVAESNDLVRRGRFWSQASMQATSTVLQLTNVALIVTGVLLARDGLISAGALFATLMLSSRALQPLAQLAQTVARLQQFLASYRAVVKVLALPVERPAGMAFLHRPVLAGGIALRDVRFTYPRAAMPTLNGVTLTVAAGERVGIIGRAGSGKSTLARLLLGLYEPTGGAVALDGVDARQIDPVDLRRNIGYVPQDLTLFRGSLRSNLTLGAAWVDENAMLRAATLAGVHDFVQGHPQGYEWPLGERGEGLSGGQRQAVALARALLLDPPILLLDEPTSQLDQRSEALLLQRLAPVVAGRTVLLVTHRLSLLSLVDRLIVVEQGRVVADGPKEAVLAALANPDTAVQPLARTTAKATVQETADAPC